MEYIGGLAYLAPNNAGKTEREVGRDLNQNGRIDDDSSWNLYNIYNVGNERVFQFKFDR